MVFTRRFNCKEISSTTIISFYKYGAIVCGLYDIIIYWDVDKNYAVRELKKIKKIKICNCHLLNLRLRNVGRRWDHLFEQILHVVFFKQKYACTKQKLTLVKQGGITCLSKCYMSVQITFAFAQNRNYFEQTIPVWANVMPVYKLKTFWFAQNWN